MAKIAVFHSLAVCWILVYTCTTCTGLLLDDDLQSQLDREIQARSQLEAQVNELQTTLNRFVENLQSECALTCPSRVSVAFMAQISASLTNPPKGHVVVFDQVLTNEGNGYNAVNGIFTAPVNGTYNFDLVVSSPPDGSPHQLHLFVKKNGIEAGYVFLDYNDKYWLRRTTDVTLHLVKGDEIWVEVDYVEGSHVIGGCCFHTHFGGFLIQAD